MQLSPLQSRLAASVIASCLLLILYLFLLSPQFALAADLSHTFSDHDSVGWTYEIEKEDEVDDAAAETLDRRSPMYEPDFPLFDRSIIGRQAGAKTLKNNALERSNLEPGDTITYLFEAAGSSSRSIELRRSLNGLTEMAEDEDGNDGQELAPRQQSSTTLWISANTCDQPDRISPDQTSTEPPQLTLYVSTSSENTTPGPAQDDDVREAIVFTEGAVMYNTSLDADVYFSISAPEVSTEFFSDTRPYNFEVAASTDQSYFAYDDQSDPNLLYADSDASSSLLTTRNLTDSSDQVITTAPYVMFAQNKNSVGINGIRNSYCGLSNWAQIRLLANGNGQMTMSMRKGGEDNLTTQEFYVTGLNASSQYEAILARAPDTSIQERQDDGSGGGAVVYRQIEFGTKPALAAFYENYTQTMYDNFEKVMQQIPCDAPSTQKYSLVKTCDDCRTAYKNWLCLVAIPRCEDYSTPDRQYLQPRNLAQPFPNGTRLNDSVLEQYGSQQAFLASRNAIIDSEVEPGPYKELLPCDDMCYDIVRSCPASLGFGCPFPENEFSFSTSYGRRYPDGTLSCNYPGSVHNRSLANAVSAPWMTMVGLMSTTLVFTI